MPVTRGAGESHRTGCGHRDGAQGSLIVTPTLRTVRLLLEPYVRDDERSFWALFDDPRVSRWFTPDRGSDEDLFHAALTDRTEGRAEVWAVREHGRYVGHVEIRPGREVDGYELVYALRPDVWGRGVGREIVEGTTAYALEVRGLHVLHATVDARNAAALALLARAGYVRVGERVEADHRVYVLARESRRMHAALR
jgi:RimJ/RimL family protein N-acetyltransferase